jgi:hypothetical protein
MATSTTITTAQKKCKPFILRVMVFSPESGYKFSIEVKKHVPIKMKKYGNYFLICLKKSITNL